MIKYILFDLDGTLVDSLDVILKAFEDACAEVGLHWDPELYKKHWGDPWNVLYPQVWPGMIPTMADKLSAAKKRHFKYENLKLILPYVSILRCFHFIGVEPILVTAASYESATKALEAMQLTQYFTGGLRTGLHKLEIHSWLDEWSPDDCLLIDDNSGVCIDAMNAGYPVLWARKREDANGK